MSFIAFVAEILGTVSGFGSSAIFVPAATLFEHMQLVLALTAMLHVVSNASKLILFRGQIPIRECIPLAMASIAFTGIGALLTAYFPTKWLQVFLGFALVIVTIAHYTTRWRASWGTSVILTAISGFFTGLVGTGGAIRAAALNSMRLEKSAFVFASSFIDFGGDAVRAVVYLHHGYMDWAEWYYLPMLATAAILGSLAGRKLLSKVPQATFEKIVALLILLSGIALIAEAI